MERIPAFPPHIPPLPATAHRPLWSVMIPVYNAVAFLPEAMESILQQQQPEKYMQIEVIDDASTDADVEALVKKIGKGRVGYYRQPENRGSLRNFETCINRSRGQLVHLLHADDKVLPGYYQKMEGLFSQNPEAGAAFCRYRCINENGKKIYEKGKERSNDGILQNWLTTIAERQRLQYATITVRREVYENLGSFYGITYGEDWEMWVRIARYYPVAYTPEILAEYRTHTLSISSTKFLTAGHLQDLQTAMHLIRQHLPEALRDAVFNRSRKYYACYGLKIAEELLKNSHSDDVLRAQVKQALALYRGPILYWLIGKLFLKQILFRR